MDAPGRLFLCARCRVQVVLCSHCDRGNRHCGRLCWRLARDAARRGARADTNSLGAASLHMPSGRGAGAYGVVLAMMVAMAVVVVVVVTFSRT